MKPGFCVKVEVTRVPPGRPSHTTSGTRSTTGWEPLHYMVEFCRSLYWKLGYNLGILIFLMMTYWGFGLRSYDLKLTNYLINPLSR